MKISDVSIKRPVFATMMIAALLVMGWFSYSGLSVELFPNVDFPFVVVQTIYPGASAETVETEVTTEIEEAVNQISGIRHIVARSQEGFSFVFIEFELETEGPIATQDVREKVAGIRGALPDDIEEPVVSQFNVDAEAVMSIAIGGRRPADEITQLVKDKIKPRLESISGVGTVDLVGGHEREILIALNPDLMESKQLAITDITFAVRSANMEIPGGRVDETGQEYLVRVKGRLETVDQFNSIIVVNREGAPIYLSEVATVKDTIAEQRSLARYNGAPAVSLEIVKQSGANVVDIAEDVRATLTRLSEELPPDVAITIVNDNSVWIEDSISEILFNIKFGTLLAVLVIFMFLLDLRPTIITGLSIPISIIATFTAMKFLGFSINFMTLLGLSLAVGILIDDSIVVVENIYRKMQEGESAREAASSGTKEIGLAVTATTFSIVVVFLPVAFMEGIVGRFFYQFGMTVAIAVMVSLFVAFSLVPMLASRPKISFGFKLTMLSKIWQAILRPLRLWNRLFDMIRPIYKTILAGALRHRIITVLTAGIVFVMAMYFMTTLDQEWMAETDQGRIYISFTTPPGTSLDGTSDRVANLENKLTDLPEVAGSYATIGSGNSEVTEGLLLLVLTDAVERERTAMDLVPVIRDIVAATPGLRASVATQPAEGGSNKPIEFSIRGENRDELTRLTREIQAIFNDHPGAADVDNTLEEGKPELQIDIDRRAADDLGLNLGTLAQTVRSFIEGDVVTRFKEGDDEFDVRVKLAGQFRESTDDIGRLLILSDKEVVGLEALLVPLNRVAKITRQSSIGEYGRYDRMPEARVNANAAEGAFTGTVSNELLVLVDSLVPLAPGYSVGVVGQEEMREESNINILKALILAVVFIYLLLASQYESFFDPLSIMLSLPLSLIGAVFALLAFGSAMNIMTNIGIVMLMGLVTKNAILLIDFVKQRRAAGVDRTTAILDAGPIRLRPILMTAFATVFGMLPLALGIGDGAEMRAPMARAVIGGMISSTILTLVVVPVVYSVVDDFVGLFGRLIKPVNGEKKVGV